MHVHFFTDVFILRHLRCISSALSAGNLFLFPADAADFCALIFADVFLRYLRENLSIFFPLILISKFL